MVSERRSSRPLLAVTVAVLLATAGGIAAYGGTAAATGDDGAAAAAPATLTDREAVAYVRMLDELRSYLRVSARYVGSDREAALYHAGHPIQCYWPFMEPHVRNADPELADRLEEDFESLPVWASGRLSASKYKRRITRSTFPKIADAEAAVVGEERLSDPQFNARVVRRLLAWTVYKYRKAHNGSAIVLMGQYQDAHQLPVRAEKRFDEHVRPTLTEAEAARIDALFERLQTTIPDTNNQRIETAPAGQVERLVRALNGNVTTAADLEPMRRRPEAAAGRARSDLDAASGAYADGRPNAARRIIAGTYLANVQWLLGGDYGYPDRPDTPLRVTYLERNFTYRLPGLIERGAPPAAVRDNVSTVRAQLRHAATIRERPVTATASPASTANATPIAPARARETTTASGTIERVAAPGVGTPVALLTLLAAALFLYRRRR